MSTVITVKNIGKKYTVSHHVREEYSTLRDAFTHSFSSFGKRLAAPFIRATADTRSAVSEQEDFWALKNVSFDVKQGERIGIIGRNGAGKSTLLKILSRITEPTTGSIRIKGRVASLLEVGTGFHPELTGRENIYLNGAILGMGRQEIKRKFDEIVDFAEIEKFLDTPVKRYSSGMYVRLAFAVAAHLEPEILIVDEVLAVGDAAFQRKCLGKMEEISTREGRTVLFVSHNMVAIESLCTVVMVLAQGRNSEVALPRDGVRKYLNEIATFASLPLSVRKDRTGKGCVLVRDIDIGSGSFAIGDDICVNLLVENTYKNDVAVRVSLSIRNQNDVALIVCDSLMTGKHWQLPAASVTGLICRLFAPPLNYGEYQINVAIFTGDEAEDWVLSAAKFSIESGVFHDHVVTLPFPVLARFQWSQEMTS